MSRIGKKIINIPDGVSITLEKEKIIAKGKHGTLERSFNSFVTLEQTGQILQVSRTSEIKAAREVRINNDKNCFASLLCGFVLDFT